MRLHLEQLDDGHWWLGIYRGDKRLAFELASTQPIHLEITEDELGLPETKEK